VIKSELSFDMNVDIYVDFSSKVIFFPGLILAFKCCQSIMRS